MRLIALICAALMLVFVALQLWSLNPGEMLSGAMGARP
jgi:hypothetical protein